MSPTEKRNAICGVPFGIAKRWIEVFVRNDGFATKNAPESTVAANARAYVHWYRTGEVKAIFQLHPSGYLSPNVKWTFNQNPYM